MTVTQNNLNQPSVKQPAVVATRTTSAVSRAVRTIVLGVAVAMIGLIITIVSYHSASQNPNGGTYLVAFGPIIFGALAVFRGSRALVAGHRANRK
jgi:uncharacterized membrane protein